MENLSELEKKLLDGSSEPEEVNYEEFDVDEDGPTYDEVYHEGWDGFYVENFDLIDNPYERGTDEYSWWEDGWKDAEAEYFDNDYQV